METVRSRVDVAGTGGLVRCRGPDVLLVGLRSGGRDSSASAGKDSVHPTNSILH